MPPINPNLFLADELAALYQLVPGKLPGEPIEPDELAPVVAYVDRRSAEVADAGYFAILKLHHLLFFHAFESTNVPTLFSPASDRTSRILAASLDHAVRSDPLLAQMGMIDHALYLMMARIHIQTGTKPFDVDAFLRKAPAQSMHKKNNVSIFVEQSPQGRIYYVITPIVLSDTEKPLFSTVRIQAWDKQVRWRLLTPNDLTYDDFFKGPAATEPQVIAFDFVMSATQTAFPYLNHPGVGPVILYDKDGMPEVFFNWNDLHVYEYITGVKSLDEPPANGGTSEPEPTGLKKMAGALVGLLRPVFPAQKIMDTLGDVFPSRTLETSLGRFYFFSLREQKGYALPAQSSNKNEGYGVLLLTKDNKLHLAFVTAFHFRWVRIIYRILDLLTEAGRKVPEDFVITFLSEWQRATKVVGSLEDKDFIFAHPDLGQVRLIADKIAALSHTGDVIEKAVATPILDISGDPADFPDFFKSPKRERLFDVSAPEIVRRATGAVVSAHDVQPAAVAPAVTTPFTRKWFDAIVTSDYKGVFETAGDKYVVVRLANDAGFGLFTLAPSGKLIFDLGCREGDKAYDLFKKFLEGMFQGTLDASAKIERGRILSSAGKRKKLEAIGVDIRCFIVSLGGASAGVQFHFFDYQGVAHGLHPALTHAPQQGNNGSQFFNVHKTDDSVRLVEVLAPDFTPTAPSAVTDPALADAGPELSADKIARQWFDDYEGPGTYYTADGKKFNWFRLPTAYLVWTLGSAGKLSYGSDGSYWSDGELSYAFLDRDDPNHKKAINVLERGLSFDPPQIGVSVESRFRDYYLKADGTENIPLFFANVRSGGGREIYEAKSKKIRMGQAFDLAGRKVHFDVNSGDAVQGPFVLVDEERPESNLRVRPPLGRNSFAEHVFLSPKWFDAYTQNLANPGVFKSGDKEFLFMNGPLSDGFSELKGFCLVFTLNSRGNLAVGLIWDTKGLSIISSTQKIPDRAVKVSRVEKRFGPYDDGQFQNTQWRGQTVTIYDDDTPYSKVTVSLIFLELKSPHSLLHINAEAMQATLRLPDGTNLLFELPKDYALIPVSAYRTAKAPVAAAPEPAPLPPPAPPPPDYQALLQQQVAALAKLNENQNANLAIPLVGLNARINQKGTVAVSHSPLPINLMVRMDAHAAKAANIESLRDVFRKAPMGNPTVELRLGGNRADPLTYRLMGSAKNYWLKPEGLAPAGDLNLYNQDGAVLSIPKDHPFHQWIFAHAFSLEVELAAGEGEERIIYLRAINDALEPQKSFWSEFVTLVFPFKPELLSPLDEGGNWAIKISFNTEETQGIYTFLQQVTKLYAAHRGVKQALRWENPKPEPVFETEPVPEPEITNEEPPLPNPLPQGERESTLTSPSPQLFPPSTTLGTGTRGEGDPLTFPSTPPPVVTTEVPEPVVATHTIPVTFQGSDDCFTCEVTLVTTPGAAGNQTHIRAAEFILHDDMRILLGIVERGEREKLISPSLDGRGLGGGWPPLKVTIPHLGEFSFALQGTSLESLHAERQPGEYITEIEGPPEARVLLLSNGTVEVRFALARMAAGKMPHPKETTGHYLIPQDDIPRFLAWLKLFGDLLTFNREGQPPHTDVEVMIASEALSNRMIHTVTGFEVLTRNPDGSLPYRAYDLSVDEYDTITRAGQLEKETGVAWSPTPVLIPEVERNFSDVDAWQIEAGEIFYPTVETLGMIRTAFYGNTLGRSPYTEGELLWLEFETDQGLVMRLPVTWVDRKRNPFKLDATGHYRLGSDGKPHMISGRRIHTYIKGNRAQTEKIVDYSFRSDHDDGGYWSLYVVTPLADGRVKPFHLAAVICEHSPVLVGLVNVLNEEGGLSDEVALRRQARGALDAYYELFFNQKLADLYTLHIPQKGLQMSEDGKAISINFYSSQKNREYKATLSGFALNHAKKRLDFASVLKLEIQTRGEDGTESTQVLSLWHRVTKNLRIVELMEITPSPQPSPTGGEGESTEESLIDFPLPRGEGVGGRVARIFKWNIRSGILREHIERPTQVTDSDQLRENIGDAGLPLLTAEDGLKVKVEDDPTTRPPEPLKLQVKDRTGYAVGLEVVPPPLPVVWRSFFIPGLGEHEVTKIADPALISSLLKRFPLHEQIFLPAEETLFAQVAIGRPVEMMTFVSPTGIILQLPMKVGAAKTSRYIMDEDADSPFGIRGARLLYPDANAKGRYFQIEALAMHEKRAAGSTLEVQIVGNEKLNARFGMVGSMAYTGRSAYALYGEDVADTKSMNQTNARAFLVDWMHYVHVHAKPAPENLPQDQILDWQQSDLTLESREEMVVLKGFAAKPAHDGEPPRVVLDFGKDEQSLREFEVYRSYDDGALFYLRDPQTVEIFYLVMEEGVPLIWRRKEHIREFLTPPQAVDFPMNRIRADASGEIIYKTGASSVAVRKPGEGVTVVMGRWEGASFTSFVADSTNDIARLRFEVTEDAAGNLSVTAKGPTTAESAAGARFLWAEGAEIKLVEDTWTDAAGELQRGRIRIVFVNREAPKGQPYGWLSFKNRQALVGEADAFAIEEAHYHEKKLVDLQLLPTATGFLTKRAGVRVAEDIFSDADFDRLGVEGKAQLFEKFAKTRAAAPDLPLLLGALQLLGTMNADHSYDEEMLRSLALFAALKNPALKRDQLVKTSGKEGPSTAQGSGFSSRGGADAGPVGPAKFHHPRAARLVRHRSILVRSQPLHAERPIINSVQVGPLMTAERTIPLGKPIVVPNSPAHDPAILASVVEDTAFAVGSESILAPAAHHLHTLAPGSVHVAARSSTLMRSFR